MFVTRVSVVTSLLAVKPTHVTAYSAHTSAHFNEVVPKVKPIRTMVMMVRINDMYIPV